MIENGEIMKNWRHEIFDNLRVKNLGPKWKYGHAEVLIKALNILDINPEKIAEVGVNYGETTRRLLDAFHDSEITLVDPWAEQKINGRLYKRSQKQWDEIYDTVNNEFGDRCNIVRKFSLDAVNDFEDKTFDLVFIDGDHSYEGVYGDVKHWLPKVKSNRLLAGHDCINDVQKAVTELIDAREIYMGLFHTFIHMTGM